MDRFGWKGLIPALDSSFECEGEQPANFIVSINLIKSTFIKELINMFNNSNFTFAVELNL